MKQDENAFEYISGMRRHFHENPELSLKEFSTALKIESELDSIGIEHERVGATGVIGYIKGTRGSLTGGTKRIIALRADTDALPITEKSEHQYTSKNPGVMHACGHDGHTAALLAAAKALQSRRGEIEGDVRLFFQQGEESGLGAKQFIDAGKLDGVEAILGIHVSPFLPSGKMAFMAGPANASCDFFRITVKGKQAHVSAPHLGVDAAYIASAIVVNLQSIVARRMNPLDSVVVGVGLMRAGTAYNIVAGEAIMEGTTRSFTPELRKKTNALVVSIAEQTARLHGGEAEVAFEHSAAPLINDARIAEHAREIAAKIIGDENALAKIPLSLTADDFADFLELVPGVYAIVGTRTDDNPATAHPLHHEEFDIDEKALVSAAKLYEEFAIGYKG
jgi:amidohydrolase